MPRLRIILGLLLLVAPALALATDNASLFQHYQTLLERHLTEQELPGDGLVSAFDYEEALRQEDTQTLLGQQADALAAFDPAGLAGKARSVAFWINAYNFFMIHQILTERPDGELVSSVWDYGGRLNPFRDNIFQRSLFTIGGQDYSLDQMEKDILLGEGYQQRGWMDARVHFAVNCAAVGCPPLRKAIYTEDNLETLLTENTRLALNTPRHLTIDGSTLRLSAIFDWYRMDFGEEAGSVRSFIRQWADTDVGARANQTNAIDYIDYDWALNQPDNFPELSQ
ncbi:DUF547 domain-containing protein [Marinobacter sp. LN3S78]|uniref:DUF547 domain-containing protein n=1 Tax=Marinobacter sp. LN3S78 TaxID=3382300 RepID=UPI00387B6D06